MVWLFLYVVWFHHYVVRLFDNVLESCNYMMWLLYYVMQFLLYVVNALCDAVLPLCYVVFFLKQCHFHFRCQTITQALLTLKNRLFLNVSPLYTLVSKNVVSVSDISAVILIEW